MARILIADDDRDYRTVFADGMTLLGHEVDAVDSADAIRIALTRKTYDIVFLDLLMPGGGTVTLVHELYFRYPEMPIVVITGQSGLYDTPLFKEGLRMAKEVLRKTAPLQSLNATVSRLVPQRK